MASGKGVELGVSVPVPFQMVMSTLLQLCLILIPMIMGGALLNTLTSSVITKVINLIMMQY